MSASTAEQSVTGAYQWYRLNPVTNAVTAIGGATHQNYTTVAADNGKLLTTRRTMATA